MTKNVHKPLSNKAFFWIICSSCLFVVALTFALIPIFGSSNFKKDTSISIVKAESTEQPTATVTWNAEDKIDNIEITVTCDGVPVRAVRLINQIDIHKGEYQIEGVNGKYTVTTKIKGSKFYESKTYANTILAPIDEANIAPLTATMPVLLFTLNNWNITNNGTIPTYAVLTRCESWDWSQLPQGMHSLPNADVLDYTVDTETEYAKYNIMQQSITYAKYLLEANPNTKINFYFNDWETYYYFYFLAEFGDKPEQFTYTFISDGADSYTYFNANFANDTAYLTYESQLSAFNTTKHKILQNNNYKTNYDINIEQSRYYTYVICQEEENCNWWLSNKSNLLLNVPSPTVPTEPDGYSSMSSDNAEKISYDTALEKYNNQTSFINTLSSTTKVINNNIATLIANINTDTTKTSQIKAVYNLNSTLFSHTPEGKKTMMFLGARLNATANREVYFEYYANYTMEYYGNDYVYYYKGHPVTPTYLNTDREELLDDMGIYDIDSTIAAELILFFFPNIYMTGFDSSTYMSVSDLQMACGFWNSTMPTDFTASGVKTYMRYMDWFMSTSSSSALSSDYSITGLDSSHKYFLIQFNNYVGSSENGDNSSAIEYYQQRKLASYDKHEIAIYDATTNSTIYYKLVDSTYVATTR